MKQPSQKRIHADTLILITAAVLLVLFAISEVYPKVNDAALPKPLAARCLLLMLVCLISYLGGLLRQMRTGDRRLTEWLLTAYFILYVYLLLSLTFVPVTIGVHLLGFGELLNAGIVVPVCVAIYFGVLLLTKDETMLFLSQKVLSTLLGRFKKK